jgi:hypothetical protein
MQKKADVFVTLSRSILSMMIPFTKHQIKEIAEQFQCGFRAFYHKNSGELVFVPDTSSFYDIEINAWQDAFEKIEKNSSEYQEIDRMETRDSFRMMADFAEQVNDINLRNKFIDALNRKKPFSQFKLAIDYSPERQNWFDFKNKRFIEWTEKQLKIHEELSRHEHAGR